MILLDNGPDNSGVRTAFLKSLVNLSNKYQIKIELVYYPPYHSKYNPIERIWARLEKWGTECFLHLVKFAIKLCNN